MSKIRQALFSAMIVTSVVASAQLAGTLPPGGGQTAGMTPPGGGTPAGMMPNPGAPKPAVVGGYTSTTPWRTPFGAPSISSSLTGFSNPINFHQTRLCQTENEWISTYQTLAQPVQDPMTGLLQSPRAPWLTDFTGEILAVIRIAGTSNQGIYPVLESIDQQTMQMTLIRYAIYIPIRRQPRHGDDSPRRRDPQPQGSQTQDPAAPFVYPESPASEQSTNRGVNRPNRSAKSPYLVVKIPRPAGNTKFVSRYVYYNPYDPFGSDSFGW